MFCRNCGQQIPDTAKFCGKCGTVTSKETNANGTNNQNVNNQHANNSNMNNHYANNQYTNNPNINNQYMNNQYMNNQYINNFDAQKVINEIGNEFISLVKNPIATVRESKSKDNNTYMIFGILAAILAVFNVYILKSAIVKNLIGIGGKIGLDALLEGKNFGIIMRLLINNILIMAIVSGVIFLILNVILKKASFTYFDGLKVVIAGYAYSTIVVFVGAIVSYIYVPLGIAIMYISLIAYMILIYEGLSSFKIVDKSQCLYIILIVMAVMMLSEYFIITSQIKSVVGSFIKDFNPMEEIMDSFFF